MTEAEITIRVDCANDADRKAAIEALASRAARAGLAAERVGGARPGLHLSGGTKPELRTFFRDAGNALAANVKLTLD